nr:colicin E3/pyocin S6 family cytotoxin [Evansella caseinilytica]
MEDPGILKEIGVSIYNSFDEQVINGTAETRGEWFGYAAGVIALSVAGDKGLSKLGNVAKVSRLGRLAGAAGLKAEHAVKLYLMNVQTRALHAVNTIVPTFGLNPALAGVPYNAINSMKMLDDLVDVNKANMMKVEKIASEGGGNVGKRVFNVKKQESSVWKDLDNVKGKDRKTTGTGRNKRYYEWDHTHNDIEVYDKKGKHLGSMDPLTGEMYKGPVQGRTITID